MVAYLSLTASLRTFLQQEQTFNLNNDPAETAAFKNAQIKGILSHLSAYRKNVCMLMMNNLVEKSKANNNHPFGISTPWEKLPSSYKQFYVKQLGEMASQSNIPLARCEDSRAAKGLLRVY
ncbi:hypothetical protein BDF20DRAFT_917514 [Mycotypha africana]|uniref:uncharacterized protein n=1 Tax=Mycotypha africana TaxID=64632 RepID=UPI0023001753|nr:uncharacterized protein BDF20DRAFT_917514 [Mycotypha africana]KAI8967581.1 hypothetical protein BDF20DRAFT_917514 [Mycotypha africana]